MLNKVSSRKHGLAPTLATQLDQAQKERAERIQAVDEYNAWLDQG
jgi:hypothetical protein